MSEKDDNLFFDSALNQAFIEQENNRNVPNGQQLGVAEEEDEFDDDFGDDLDLNELVEVTETAEQQHAANNGINISFVPPNDPPPPPPLPESTTSFHPLDVENLRTWIYPTNYPVRGYQLNIVQKAMFNNTLVALPTGLGKTFIAAVVMYNYWRWFPNSLIIFMAPTRPLVTQQIEACFRICGLPQEDTCDISGTVAPAKRRELYKTKRVFFATPQTINNDLQSKSCPANKIVCLVIDEAHRATGNFAYCEVIKKVSRTNKEYRVLALTATPGSKLDSVQNVIDNLKISNIQIRTEESMDIREFTFGKNIQSIIVRLGYTEGSTGILPKIIQEFKQKVFEPLLKSLNKSPAGISSNVDSITTYGLTASRARFTATADNINNGFKFYIIKQILVAEQMSRAYDMLCQHGISPFLESIEASRQEVEAVKAAGKNPGKAAEEYYNNSYINQMIPYLKREMSKLDFLGHPKMDQLVGILLKHFANLSDGASSKVMIFSSFRSSVTEICRVLNRHTPLIRCSFFVGQSEGKNGIKGLKQTEQQEVIQKFKRDEYNVLVATSIGEEGLDIGEVDLIICYDSQASPIRMLQRMGRTGRKRQGKCIMLMTELEERKFTQAKETYARVQRLITQGAHLNYYKPNPSIIPTNYRPTICRKEVTIGTFIPKELKQKRRVNGPVVAANVNSDGLMNIATEKEFVRSLCDDANMFSSLSQAMDRYWPLKPLIKSIHKFGPLQTAPKPTHRVAHSNRTLQFTNLIQKMEHRILFPNEQAEFNMPFLKQKAQTKLILPSKGSSLKIPNKRKKRDEALDDAFTDFLQQNDVSQFMDPIPEDDLNDFAEPSYNRNTLNHFIIPKQKEKQKQLVQPSIEDDVGMGDILPLPRRDKGKEKMRASQERSLVSEADECSKGESSPLHDPFLPESVFEDAIPFEDNPISTTELKLSSSYKQQRKEEEGVLLPEQQEEVMDIDMDGLHDGYDEFGDSVFDEMFLAAEKEALEVTGLKGFDDALSPEFPFEKGDVSKDPAVNHVAFIWTQSSPGFSDKALELLEKRQIDIKKLTGKFVAMNFYTKFKMNAIEKRRPSSIVISSQQQQQQQKYEQSQGFDDDDFTLGSDFLEQAAALESGIQQPQKEEEVITIPATQSSIREKAENNAEEEEDDFREGSFGGFSDIDFDGSAFANIIENKFSDDEHTYHGYMHEEEHNIASQHVSQMKEKQSLYLSSSPSEPGSPTAALPPVEKEDIYEINFDDTPTPPSVAATSVKEEVIYEYNFGSSAENESDAQIESKEEKKCSNDVNSSPHLNTTLVDDSNQVTSIKNTAKAQQDVLTPVLPLFNNNHDDLDDGFEPNTTSRISPVQNRSIIVRVEDDEAHQSPTKLLQISRGLAPLSLPLYSSPLRQPPSRNLHAEESDESPLIPVRRKRRVIDVSPITGNDDEEDFSLTNKPKKRLKRKLSTPSSSPHSIVELDDDEDDDIVVGVPPSKNLFLQKLKESRKHDPQKPRRRIKQTLEDLVENLFMDVEAEKSSDEGHTSDEEREGNSSILNSFIDDESLYPESRASVDDDGLLDEEQGIARKKKKVNIYRLMNDDDVVASNSKHWMNRFDANKWLNTEEDSLIEEEEEETEEDPESVSEFSSHIVPHEDPIFNDDDDFM